MATKPMQLLLEVHGQLMLTLDLATCRLTAAKQEFHTWQAQVDKLNGQQKKCFFLDVGGQPFHVSSDAVVSGRSKLLALLASDDFAPETDDNGYIFLDRDPRWFATVLGYIKADATGLPHDRIQRRAVYHEAVYYQVDALELAVSPFPPHVVLLGLGCRKQPAIQAYNIWTDAWQTIQCPFLKNWEVLGCCGVANSLYIAGRRCSNGKELPHTLMKYNPQSGSFCAVSHIPVATRHCCMEYIESMILVIGPPCQRLFPIVQPYHVDIDQWSHATELSDLLSVSASCVINDRLILVDQRGRLAACKYAAPEKHWELLYAVDLQRIDYAIVPFDDRLMAIGGAQDRSPWARRVLFLITNNVVCIDVETGDVLQELAQLNVERKRAHAVMIDNRVFVIGGEGSDSRLITSVDVFAPSITGGTWSHLTDIPKQHHDFMAVALSF